MGAKITCLLKNTSKEARDDWNEAFKMMQMMKKRNHQAYVLLEKTIRLNEDEFKKHFWS